MTTLLSSCDTEAPVRGIPGWLILHARPRQEKRLAADLQAMGISCELPKVRLVRTYGHRRRIVDMPLFPSFVFARASEEDVPAIRDTGRLVDVISVRDVRTLERDLAAIDRALEAGATPEPSPFIRTGSRVRVRSGDLAGLEGMADQRLAPDRLILGIEAIGRAVSIPVPSMVVERLAEAA